MYDLRFRVVRFRISGGCYETVYTNLDSETFPIGKIKELYRLRWGIETSFRELELTVIILCGVADGVCLGPKKQHDLVGELLQRPLGGGFQKRGQLPANQKQRRKDSAEIIMEQLNSGQLDTSDIVTASAHASSMGGSQIWLKEGEQMSVDEMLKCIAVNSANDCAVAMAEHISGSEEAFTKRMNDRAKELGMENTQFLNCTGLTDDPGHYTTARDIACMSRALLAHPRIRDYTTIWMDTVRDGRFGLANTNKLIHAYPGATGLKTGYTQQAMHCLSASAERAGVEYIAVVLHAESSKARFADAATLLNFAFANYSLYSVAANTVIPPVRVRFAETDSVQPVLSGTDAIVVRKGMAAPQTDIALNEDLCAPLEPGAQVGTVTVTDSSGDTLILPLVVPDGAARISTAHLWLQLLRAL